jgi:hypothetical protein
MNALSNQTLNASRLGAGVMNNGTTFSKSSSSVAILAVTGFGVEGGAGGAGFVQLHGPEEAHVSQYPCRMYFQNSKRSASSISFWIL